MADKTEKQTAYDRSKDKYTLNPAPSYNFALQVEGFFFVPCKSIRVFTREHEFDYYQEGGLNDYVHMLRKPISKPFTFQVERYVGVSTTSTTDLGFVDALALGTELILPVLLFVSRYPSYHFWENWNPQTCARVYTFTGCTVTAKEFGELNAERSGLATETTTIAYRELLVINNLSNSSSLFDKDEWKSEAQAETYSGEGDPIWFKNVNGKYAYKANDTYTRQKGLDHAKSDMWVIDKDDYKGKGNRHVQTTYGDKNNPSKSDQETAAAKDMWGIDQYDYAGKGNRHVQKDKGDKNNPKKKDQEKKGTDEGWMIGGDDYKGNNKRHVQKDKGDKNNPTKKAQEDAGRQGEWVIDPTNYKGGGKRHVQTDKGDKDNPTKADQAAKGAGNTWVYDGTVDGGGTPHSENRNKNKKADPVIWPPTRRALMADALSNP